MKNGTLCEVYFDLLQNLIMSEYWTCMKIAGETKKHYVLPEDCGAAPSNDRTIDGRTEVVSAQ